MISIILLKTPFGKRQEKTRLKHFQIFRFRLQSQGTRVRPPRRQQMGAKNPLKQIQATIPTENQYTEVHTNLSEQELRRLKRAQSSFNSKKLKT